MSRYTVSSPWSDDTPFPPFVVQSADIVDTKTGDTFREGASRVVDTRTGKAVRGKGGTTPFFGESAWSAADRLASDLALKVRYS